MAAKNAFDQFDNAPANAFDAFDDPATAPKPAGTLRRAADTALALGRGIVAVPETAVGISDLITGGRTGKAVERLGVRFKDAKQVLTDFQSDEQKAADARVQQADGFLPTVGAMIENPSTIANAVAESAPSMLAGGAVSRGLVNKGVNGITAGAVGEGVVSAGQAAEQVRQEGPTGFLTPKQAALAATSGAATGVINRASGKLADKLGIGDVNTAMATGKLGGTTERGIAQRTAYGAINEGVLQELPQSMQEQALQNLALDKPVGEGVAEAGAAGMLVGGLTGGGFGALTPPSKQNSVQPGATLNEQGGGNGVSNSPVKPPSIGSTEIESSGQSAATVVGGQAAPTKSVLDVGLVRPEGGGNHSKPEAGLAQGDGLGKRPGELASGGLDGGSAGLSQGSSPSLNTQNSIVKPPVDKAAAIGINRNEGPLSAGAAIAVDTGADVVTQQQAVEKQKAEAAAKEKAKPGADGKKPEPEAPAPVQPAPADPTAPITGPFTQAIHGAANVTPTPAPAVDPQGPATPEGVGAQPDAPAAPGVGADQGPQGAGAVPAAVPEPVAAPVTPPPTQESTNATQQSRQGETIDPETGEITQTGPQGAGGDGGQRPEDALQPGADAKGPQPAPDQPAAPAAASTPAEGGTLAPVEPVGDDTPKARWLKNVADAQRLAGPTGVQIGGLVNGRINFLGDPRSSKQARAMAATVDEAIKAGATPQEIVDAAMKPPPAKPPAPTAPVDLGAHTAATSPHNDRPEPTQAQKEAGNYKKAHLVISGVGISVENPEGSVRSGTDADGKDWSNTMQWHYGYAKRTVGSDDEQQDVFVKPGTPLDYAGQVFVVDQINPKTGKHDEYKSMVGAKSPMEARKAYMGHYAKDWKGLKNVTALTWDQWREWLQAPKGTAPSTAEKSAQDGPATSASLPATSAPTQLVETPPVLKPAPASETAGPVAEAPKTPKVAPAATPPAPSGQEDQGEGQIASSQASPDGTPDPAAGKWFGTKEKADEKLASMGLTETHEVVRDGLRFAFRKKAPAAPANPLQQKMADAKAKKDAPTPAPATEVTSENARRSEFALSNGTKVKVVETGDRGRFSVSIDDSAAWTSWGTFLMDDRGMVSGRKYRAGWAESSVDEAANTFSAMQRGETTNVADAPKPKKPVTPQIPNDPAVTYGLPTFASNGTAKSPEARKAPGAEVEAAYIQALDGKPFNSGLTLTAAKMSNAIREKNAVMLADVVNPDNKVSREAFRILTGVTLPKGLLATQNAVNAYLNPPAAPAPKPEIVVDKAEIRPYRKPDGSIGYEAVPIQPPTPVVEPEPKAKPVASANTIFTEDAAAAARARLKAKLGRLNSGLDPETMLDGITLAGYHIEKGARTFAAYAKAMLEDLGDGVKPYLKSWYMGVRYDPRASGFDGMSSAAEVDAADVDALQTAGDITDVEPIPNVTPYDKSDLDEPAPRDGWVDLDYIQADDRVSYPVHVREIRTSKDGVSRAIRQIRIYNPNAGRYMAAWEWESTKLDSEVFDGLRIDQAIFHYSLSSNTEEAFGDDASNGDALWARYGDQIVNALKQAGTGSQPRAGDQAALPAPASNSSAIEKPPKKADTSPNGSRDDATDSQPGVGQRDPGAVQGADGGRGAPAQQPAAPVDSGNLEAPQPTDAPEPAGPPAADAPGVRAPVADVGPGAGTAGRGNAGNGRTRAGGKGNSAAGARGRGTAGPAPAVKAPESVSPANPGPGDFSIDDPLKIIGGGQVARFEKNKAAIEMRNRLQDEGRMPTREEQTVLAGYTGWGSFGQELFQGSCAKPAPKSGWEARDKWLRENLGQKEWEGMQTSIINAHYTDPPTVLAMWEMVRRMGFTGGRTLEPSIGIGNFYGMMPADMVGRSQRAGIELDPLTGSMAQMLYPNANIQIKGYEASTTPDNF